MNVRADRRVAEQMPAATASVTRGGIAETENHLRNLDWRAADYRLVTAPQIALSPHLLWGWSGLTLEGLAYTLVADRRDGATVPRSHVGLQRLIKPLDQNIVWFDTSLRDGEVVVTRRQFTRLPDGRQTLGVVPPTRQRLSNAATYIVHARPIVLPEEL